MTRIYCLSYSHGVNKSESVGFGLKLLNLRKVKKYQLSSLILVW